MLTLRVSENDVERALIDRYKVSGKSAQRYLARAKRSLLDAANRPRQEHVADAYAFYCSVIANPNAKDSEKLKAQERIDRLLALDRPRRNDRAAAHGVSRLPPWLIGRIDRSGPVPTAEPANVVDGAEEYERLMAEFEARRADSQGPAQSAGQE